MRGGGERLFGCVFLIIASNPKTYLQQRPLVKLQIEPPQIVKMCSASMVNQPVPLS